MQSRKELDPHYGKLTVLSEASKKVGTNWVRMVRVKCTCGTVKQVRAPDLVRGKVKSCGAGACKNYSRAGADATFWPQPPKVCTVEQLEQWWKQNTTGSKARKSVLAIAKENGINDNTLSYLFRSIRRAGGITLYKRKVQQWLNATTKKSTPGTTPAPKRRRTAPPATKPAGKPKPKAKSARATARKSTTSAR